MEKISRSQNIVYKTESYEAKSHSDITGKITFAIGIGWNFTTDVAVSNILQFKQSSEVIEQESLCEKVTILVLGSLGNIYL